MWFVSTKDHVTDVLTKGLPNNVFQDLISKLGMKDIHSPAWGWVLADRGFLQEDILIIKIWSSKILGLLW